MEIVAHRGASNLAPENTLAAVNLAWSIGADAVEIDIRLTTDNRIVVIHDGSALRTAGEDLVISRSTSAELRELDFGKLKDNKYKGEKIPFLEEVIATIPEGKKLLVEVKCGKEITPFLQDIICSSGKASQVSLIGFDLETMAHIKASMPEIPNYWLIGPQKDTSTQKWLPHNTSRIDIIKDRHLDGVDAHYAGVTKGFTEAVQAFKLGVYTWTVNDMEEAKRLRDCGVDGITTDKPELLLTM